MNILFMNEIEIYFVNTTATESSCVRRDHKQLAAAAVNENVF